MLPVARLGAAGQSARPGAGIVKGAPLADAVQHGDKKAVPALLKAHADVNAPQGDGATALHWAAYLDDVETTALLLGAGASAKAPNNYGITPLVLASKNGNVAIIDQLLKAGADPNGTVDAGETPLMYAARTGKVDAMNALLNAGAKIDAKETWNGQTALMWAAAAGQGPVVQTLIDHKADIHARSNGGTTPFMFAVRKGDMASVQALLAAGVDVNEKRPDLATPLLGQTALMWAAAAAQGPVVQTLIDRKADIHARSNGGTTPFMFAVRKGDMGSVQALLTAGVDVNEKRPDLATPLLLAIINGHEDLVDLLLDTGADPNAEGGSTELTVQGMRARPQKIELKTPSFREQLRDVGTEGGNGRNNTFGRPLQAAVHVANWHISDEFVSVNLDRLRIIKSLLKHGADVNGRNTDMEPRWSGARYRRRLVGATAFLFAAKVADVEVMRLLLENGADPKINTGVNITPLMAAAGIAWASNQDRASEQQVLEAVKLLVEELGADVNFVADTGETAMHAASYRAANSVVQYLFDKGAKLDVADKSGRTPLRVADGVEYGNSFAANPTTAVLLRKLGAKEILCPGLCLNLIPQEALPREEVVR
ncbi:MAG: hypothetical protein AUF76_01290 [Acidobacteria bacterium 13_1_20CM_2_65_9]|nr:MAG: hypothetical protein AUF76_01290 [Acidobacteria bacterium 13_1_20CM_2_65_9]